MLRRDRYGRYAPMTDEEIALIRELRAAGHTQSDIARITGFSHNSVCRLVPGWVGKVPVAPLRQAFLDSPVTAADIARDLGWWDSRGDADSARVKRTLGLVPDRKNGHQSRRRLVDAETVQLIAEAIGISPFAVLPDDDDEVAT